MYNFDHSYTCAAKSIIKVRLRNKIAFWNGNKSSLAIKE